jgi:hypothetical protein
MIRLSILAMIGGLALLIYFPLSKNRLKRLTSQSAGAAAFGIGLIGLILSLLEGRAGI